MADFPEALTNAVDGPPGVGTEIIAAHLNNLEAKVGIDESAIVTSLDYLLKNPASIDPGHLHSLYALSSTYLVGNPGVETFAGAVAALNALGTPIPLVIPPGNHAVNDNLTVNSNIQLIILKGADFQIATAKTLTINGRLDAGRYQIFSCTGTGKVVFGQALTVYPEWWADNITPGTTNMYAAIQAALTSLANGGKVKLTGTYLSSGSTISWPAVSNLSLEGIDRGTKLIIKHADNYGISINLTDGMSGVTIRNLTIQGADDFTDLPETLVISYGSGTISNFIIQNVEFKYSTLGGLRLANGGAITNNVLIDNCYFHHINWSTHTTAAGGVVHVYDGSNITIRNCQWDNVITDISNTTSHAIYWEKADQGYILNNYFNGQNARCQIYDGTGAAKTNLVIAGNVFNGVKNNPFYHMTDGLIVNNIFYGCNIVFVSNTSVKFNNNIIDGNFSGQNVITVSTSGGVEISGNRIINIANPIYITSSGYVDIYNNHIVASTGKTLLLNTNAGAGSRIIDNYMESADDHPIGLNNTTATKIMGNRISSISGKYIIAYFGADPSLLILRDNRQVGAGYTNCTGITSLPYQGTTTLSSGTKAITFPGALADANYQVTLAGGANETFYVTNKATTGFTINSSNGSSTASVDYVVIR